MNWTSANIQAVSTLSSQYANFSNLAERITSRNTISDGVTQVLGDQDRFLYLRTSKMGLNFLVRTIAWHSLLLSTTCKFDQI